LLQRNWLKSVGACVSLIWLINLDDLVSSSTAQISKSFSLQLCEISFSLKYKYTKTPPVVDFNGRNFILIYRLAMWDVAGPVPPYDVP
jgi:hypothetical protein